MTMRSGKTAGSIPELVDSWADHITSDKVREKNYLVPQHNIAARAEPQYSCLTIFSVQALLRTTCFVGRTCNSLRWPNKTVPCSILTPHLPSANAKSLLHLAFSILSLPLALLSLLVLHDNVGTHGNVPRTMCVGVLPSHRARLAR